MRSAKAVVAETAVEITVAETGEVASRRLNVSNRSVRPLRLSGRKGLSSRLEAVGSSSVRSVQLSSKDRSKDSSKWAAAGRGNSNLSGSRAGIAGK